MVEEVAVFSPSGDVLTTASVDIEDLLSVESDLERCRRVYDMFARLAEEQVEGPFNAAELFNNVQLGFEEFAQIIQGRIGLIIDSIEHKPDSWHREGNTYSCNYVGPFGTPIVLERENYYQDVLDDGIETLRLRNIGTDGSILFSAERLDSGGTRYVFCGVQPVPGLSVTRKIDLSIEKNDEAVLIIGHDKHYPSHRLTFPPYIENSFQLHVKG